ncbi:MAG: hypothetical protein IPO00_07015 [Betaproteobacteria bacterium]|nr:hypothetical protein [Betaproteobacteria bacterium]
MTPRYFAQSLAFLYGAVAMVFSHALNAAPSDALAQAPIYLTASQKPLVMLTMARDHRLYYEAYNDYSDLDGDGSIDIGYKPSITYEGYYDSEKCYTYDTANKLFKPVSVTANKKCSGQWSGDFLNYVTTARIDALRKVLYGGKRSTDIPGDGAGTGVYTVLERTFIPQDAHAWAKEYMGAGSDAATIALNGYDIREYTPLQMPSAAGYTHLFGNVSLNATASEPLMRVLSNTRYRPWEWVSIESSQGPAAGDKCNDGTGVKDCVSGGGWAVVPASITNGLSGLTIKTYNTTGNSGNPTTEAGLDSMESTYGIAAKECGSGSISTIDGSANPFVPGSATCTSDDYMTIITGTLNIPAAGSYQFAVDGDDAVDVWIDGTNRASWYGGHGDCDCYDHASGVIALTAGAHSIKFRHQEGSGGDSFTLSWLPTGTAPSMTNYTVRVEVCNKTVGLESNCTEYAYDDGGVDKYSYKPTGILHNYAGAMQFGLMTGSYGNNLNGGLIRKEIFPFSNEFEKKTGVFYRGATPPTGISYKDTTPICDWSYTKADATQLTGTTCAKGVVAAIDALRIKDYNGSSYSTCGWITNRAINDNECRDWGNPLGEMVYEVTRYFAGKAAATASFSSNKSVDEGMGLVSLATWGDPYGTGSGQPAFPACSKPYSMLISDVYPSFDSDSVPGSPFSAFAGDLGASVDVKTLGATVWDAELGSGAKNIFIGETTSPAAVNDYAPTAKSADNLAKIRGLTPSDPTRQGSYSSALMAYYAHINDLSAAAGSQKLSTYSIALTAPLPEIEIPVAGKTIKLAAFAKSVYGPGSYPISPTTGLQPTNQIVDFYFHAIRNVTGAPSDAAVNGGRPYYLFQINYEDVEQGADHDMDAIAQYEVKVLADDTVQVKVDSLYAAGGIVQHMGYVISGSTTDGAYLVVRDCDTANSPTEAPCKGGGADPASDYDFALDSPNTAAKLPVTSTVVFAPASSASTALQLKDPLWYAAKWGGFSDANGNNSPDDTEWNTTAGGTTPSNYFLVTNPSKLRAELEKAFNKIRDDSGTSAALSTNSFSFQTDTLLFQSRFNSDGWTGELNAYPVTASSIGAPAWQAQIELGSKAANDRVILTYDPEKAVAARGIPFRWASMSNTSTGTAVDGVLEAALNKNAANTLDTKGAERVTYLRGDEDPDMRSRPKLPGTSTPNKLGDIVNSQAQYVGRPNFGYAESGYALFSVAQQNRTPMVYVGANDGMLHGFKATRSDSDSGEEKLAYIPSEMYRKRPNITGPRMSLLTDASYGKAQPHRYFVDGTPVVGDICTNTACTAAGDWKTILVGGYGAGGQGMYALDVTNPLNFSEANAATIVKWEFKDADHDGATGTGNISGDANLGYTFGRPYIVKLCTNRDTGSASAFAPKTCLEQKWFVLFGNGYKSEEADGSAGTGKAVLYVLNAETGYLATSAPITVGAAGNGPNNGLSELAPIDVDGDGVIDLVYAGDLKGNMWRFDFFNESPSNWQVAFGGDPLYTSKDWVTPTPAVQPITTAPDVITHPQGGVLVVFGTGTYLFDNDKIDKQFQAMYGIWDSDAEVSATNHSNLQEQFISTNTIADETTTSIGGGTAVTVSHDYRSVSTNTVDWASKKGWFIRLAVDYPSPTGWLAEGERIVFNPEVRGGNVLKFTSTIPESDICAAGGYGWDYYLDALSGGALPFNPFTDYGATSNFTFSNGTTGTNPAGRKSTIGIVAPGTIITEGQGRGTVFQGGSTGEMDYYKANLGQGTAGRLSWRELMTD